MPRARAARLSIPCLVRYAAPRVCAQHGSPCLVRDAALHALCASRLSLPRALRDSSYPFIKHRTDGFATSCCSRCLPRTQKSLSRPSLLGPCVLFLLATMLPHRNCTNRSAAAARLILDGQLLPLRMRKGKQLHRTTTTDPSIHLTVYPFSISGLVLLCEEPASVSDGE